MRCSVPLELELTILEFAAPPLAIDRLHDRVAFFIKISLVHRSITAWAQDRLRDQFLYTYYRRLDEYERLKARFDAGFGRNRSVRRLYLDLTRLPREGRERTRSIFTAVGGWAYRLISSVGRRSVPAEADMRAQEQARQEVANFVPYGDDPNDGYWELCGLITAFSQTLDTLWLKAPLTDLDITDLPPPRVLYVDDYAFDDPWYGFGTIPASSRMVLFLRNISLPEDDDDDNDERCRAEHVVFNKCYAPGTSLGDMLEHCPRLETLVLSEMEELNLVSAVYSLPASIRRVHILQHDLKVENSDFDVPNDLHRLESFTFTWLAPAVKRWPWTSEDPAADPLGDLQRAIESTIVAPECTFRYLRSTKSPEDALADALAAFNLAS